MSIFSSRNEPIHYDSLTLLQKVFKQNYCNHEEEIKFKVKTLLTVFLLTVLARKFYFNTPKTFSGIEKNN